MGTFHRATPARHQCGGPVRPIFGNDPDHPGHKPDYKTAALCKQVRRTLALTLAGECADPLLQELIVDEVLPAPNAGRLLVRVIARPRTGGIAEILQRLAQVQKLLRARVGEAIVRKRTPELTFDVLLLPEVPRD
ncbi:MAG TPA: hypothetical protein VHM90_06485 [Phycisphaerae bacterium]|nr:hypothetical protein [Phycisphaerae bacterium]